MNEAPQFLKLALVGLGKISESQLQAFSRPELEERFRLVGAHDKDPGRQELLSRFPLPKGIFCDTLEQLLQKEPDVVLVSTPTRTHFELARILLEQERSVILEKPATTSLEEFNALIDLAERRNVFIIIAFHTAFALDLLWFVETYEKKLRSELGAITGFHCGFYDHYDCPQELDRRFESLGGSWTDSGINALSVLHRLVDLDSARIEEALLTRPPAMPGEIHGHVRIVFSSGEEGKAGRGTIETNWMLGFSRKRTHLYFASSPDQIILDHTAQKVLRVSPSGSQETLKDFSGEGPRMVNQYLVMFKEAWDFLSKGNDNVDTARKIHNLFFKVPDT